MAKYNALSGDCQVGSIFVVNFLFLVGRKESHVGAVLSLPTRIHIIVEMRLFGLEPEQYPTISRLGLMKMTKFHTK